MLGCLTDRSLSLRTGRKNLSREKLEARERVRWKIEETHRKEERLIKLRNQSQVDKDLIMNKIAQEPEVFEAEEINDEIIVADNSDDSDWEDIPKKKKNSSNKNTMSLKNFAREVDRYQWSDRGAAKVANGLSVL